VTGTVTANAFSNAVATVVFSDISGHGTFWSGAASFYCEANGGLLTTGPYYSSQAAISVGQKPMEKWTPAVPLSCPPGKFIYVITEGAGFGDSVRRLRWSESERASDAIAQVGGISQISGKKIWIARPSPQNRDKSTILNINWESISRHGDNETNYSLLPGDRVVVQQDATNARSNSISMHTSGTERIEGIVALTASAIQGLRDTPGSAAAVREIVRKGVFDDAPELKRAVDEMIRISEEPRKRP
jgi:hypothetical protein